MYGSGTSSDPYCIEDVMDLQAIGSYPKDAYYRLVEDIDASATSGWNGGEGFDPIAGFEGYFDGQNHIIDQLYINKPTSSSRGLFGTTLTGAIISGVNLKDIYCFGNYQVGALIGRVLGATDVNGCKSTGELRTNEDDVGGLIGQIWLDAVTSESVNVLGCSSGAMVYCKSEGAGGVIGGANLRDDTNRILIEDCHATGEVTMTELPTQGGSEGGGFIGIVNGSGSRSNLTINRCSSIGDVYAIPTTWRQFRNGGFAGWLYGCLVTECYSLGSVHETGLAGYSQSGGFVGAMWTASIRNCYSRGTPIRGRDQSGGFSGRTWVGSVINCYSTGVPSGATYVGGFNGRNYTGTTFTECFWDTETSGKPTSAGGTGKTTAQMKEIQTFLDAGWDFQNVWLIDPKLNDGYPTFKRLAEAGPIWM